MSELALINLAVNWHWQYTMTRFETTVQRVPFKTSEVAPTEKTWGAAQGRCIDRIYASSVKQTSCTTFKYLSICAVCFVWIVILCKNFQKLPKLYRSVSRKLFQFSLGLLHKTTVSWPMKESTISWRLWSRQLLFPLSVTVPVCWNLSSRPGEEILLFSEAHLHQESEFTSWAILLEL